MANHKDMLLEADDAARERMHSECLAMDERHHAEQMDRLDRIAAVL
jgi:hypothetical protein